MSPVRSLFNLCRGRRTFLHITERLLVGAGLVGAKREKGRGGKKESKRNEKKPNKNLENSETRERAKTQRRNAHEREEPTE